MYLGENRILGQQGEAAAHERVKASRTQAALAEAKRLRAIKRGRRQSAEDAVQASKGNVQPTPERKKHGLIVEAVVTATDSETAKAGARVRRTQSPIERYAKRNLITDRQAMAADDLRSDWEFGIVGITGGARIVKAGGPISMSDAQLDAATAYRVAVQSIGQRLSAILLPIVIGDAAGGDITAEHLAKFDACPYDRKQIMGILGVGLDMLADHYQKCDNRHRSARYS